MPSSGKRRIVVVGDSYVEALQVNSSASFSERLQEKVASGYDQVYRFGISGAPLSQYLYMLLEILPIYKPSLVIVNLVHNDFAESLVQGSGTYGASFARVVFDEEGVAQLTRPSLYKPNKTAWIKKSAIFRYFWVRQQVRPQKLKNLWNKLFQERVPDIQYAANINVADLSNLDQLGKMIAFIFGEFAKLQKTFDVNFLLVLDGDRSAIIDSIDSGAPFSSRLEGLHLLVRQEAERYGLSFVDLTEMLQADYKENRRRFNFLHDGHWNSYTHELVAEKLSNEILDR